MALPAPYYSAGLVELHQGDARALPLPDASVDLIITSPPYFGLRDYGTTGQLGAEPSPAEYIAALIECTAEMVRVLKPSGSIFVNLGDKYSGAGMTGGTARSTLGGGRSNGRARDHGAETFNGSARKAPGRPKSLQLLPERYRIAAVDELGLIARAVIVWSKPNGLPESVTDRVRRSHEDWVHLTKSPRYFAAVDEIREPYSERVIDRRKYAGRDVQTGTYSNGAGRNDADQQRGVLGFNGDGGNPLGKLPGSVWSIPTQPLRVPESLGVDHFACIDTETEVLTRRGWLRHDQVEIGDEVAGYDMSSGITSWTTCDGVHRYDYDGDLVTADARGLSMRLTPNHRTLVHDHRGRHRTRRDVQVIEASTLDKRHSIPRAVQWADDGREHGIGTAVAALCGWIAAEGWYRTLYSEGWSEPTGNVHLSQSATVNPDKVADIDKLLASVPHMRRDAGDRGISHERGKYRARLRHEGKRVTVGAFDTRDEAAAALTAERERLGIDGLLRTERTRVWRGREWVDVTWRLPRGFGDHIRRLMPDKLLTPAMGSLPIDEARALLDAFVDGDGNRRADGRISAFQKIRQNLDVLQVIAVRLGYNTTLTRDDANDRWVLYMNPPRPARLRRADGTSLVGREHYTGTVWCVTTGTGTFVARRNGTVFVTGNSFPMEWPRRIIAGWCPREVCTVCGEGRRPVVSGGGYDPEVLARRGTASQEYSEKTATGKPSPLLSVNLSGPEKVRYRIPHEITGYACACPDTSAPSTPGVVLDPFGGTGTTALVAAMNGRRGISVDLNPDYCRLATWRAQDPKQRAKAAGRPLLASKAEPLHQPDGLFDSEGVT